MAEWPPPTPPGGDGMSVAIKSVVSGTLFLMGVGAEFLVAYRVFDFDPTNAGVLIPGIILILLSPGIFYLIIMSLDGFVGFGWTLFIFLAGCFLFFTAWGFWVRWKWSRYAVFAIAILNILGAILLLIKVSPAYLFPLILWGGLLTWLLRSEEWRSFEPENLIEDVSLKA